MRPNYHTNHRSQLKLIADQKCFSLQKKSQNSWKDQPEMNQQLSSWLMDHLNPFSSVSKASQMWGFGIFLSFTALNIFEF